ncbi:non-ribosomal peptide synthetase module [Paenibacillus chibensis]|uniref:Non-ribosomal peptide synthetase module n=1 Tax=Paenibacillus chibensis TaxID=59846 RepID=A0ABU6PMN5_9BACL|nr:non-ribosomal peptide synthetase module [Paenibacillus chibensis]MEC0372349.1 non-ribosomal peptide synthetase module [Paenibacillus chibensis]MED5016124.1 non-ribosomal peptide synthetase module [Paenibacillus chibensis]
MAQRLATEYVKATFQMTELQLNQFMHSAECCHMHIIVKVLDSGGQEIVLEDESGEEVHFPLESKNGLYFCELSCRLVNPRMTNLVRKLFVACKGEGIVNRIYQGFTMMYYYENGSVRMISEVTPSRSKLVYEYKHTAGELQRVYQLDDVEQEISLLYQDINYWLDERNKAETSEQIARIDDKLRQGAAKWFALEA